MTIKLYDDFPYETEFSAAVLACEACGKDAYDLILDRTLFFPEEGGQTPDRGFLQTAKDPETAIPVLDVQIDKEGTIRHRISQAMLPGTAVTGRIHWQHRFSNMQNHTGEHIFSGIAHARYGCENTGFHLSDAEVHMDYDRPLSPDQVTELELAVNKIIAKNVPIRCWYPAPEELASIPYRSKKEIDGALRIVEIEDCDFCACCAPHVKSTGEVGMLKVLYTESWKGGIRIHILCGLRALEEFSRLQKACSVVSREYSVPVSAEDFTSAMENRNNSLLKLKQKLEALQQSYMAEKLSPVAPDAADVLLFVNGIDDIVKRDALNALVQTHSGCCSIFDGNDTDGYAFIIASRTTNCNEKVKLLREAFGARGGGKPVMVQGRVAAAEAQIREILS